MRIAYISGPYRAKTLRGVIDNIRKAEAVAIELWQMGYAVLCPHTNTALFPEGAGDIKQDGIDYIAGDLEFLKRLEAKTDIIVMLQGYEKSAGATVEHRECEWRKFKIFQWPKDRKKIQKYVKEF